MTATKNRTKATQTLDRTQTYPFAQAFEALRKITFTKFDASVDIDLRLGIDPRKGDQIVRGVVSLPHGTGKVVRVLALCEADKQAEAKAAGAEHVGLEAYIEKISKGWVDVDAIITQPSLMPKLGKLGRILGPRGLMPNPKAATVTDDIGQGVLAIKAGKIDIKTDKNGIVHAAVGRVSFSVEQLVENVQELLHVINHLRPSSAKGVYLRSIFVSSTMSPSIEIDRSSL